MLLTFQELCTFLKADEPTVFSLIEVGSVPPPVNIGDRLVRWLESDLVKWVQAGCPRFPPPAPDELELIRTRQLEEARILLADMQARLAAERAEYQQ
jgi:predicted DNA-binding transcriptional regulator AlpA